MSKLKLPDLHCLYFSEEEMSPYLFKRLITMPSTNTTSRKTMNYCGAVLIMKGKQIRTMIGRQTEIHMQRASAENAFVDDRTEYPIKGWMLLICGIYCEVYIGYYHLICLQAKWHHATIK